MTTGPRTTGPRDDHPPIHLTGSIAALNHTRLCAELRRQGQPWLVRRGVFVLAGLLLVAQILIGAYNGARPSPLPDWVSYAAFGVFFVGLYGLLQWRNRIVRSGVGTAPSLGDETSYKLTAEGLTLTHPLGHTLLRWPAILDVVDLADAVLFRTGPLEYIAIPHMAFSNGEDRAETIAQARHWIAEAKGKGHMDHV